MEGYLTSARKIDYCKNEWADIHLKPAFQRRRVGGNPLSAKNLGKTSGCQPTRIDYFDLNEWVYPLCKITYNGMNMPYNSIFLHFN